MTRRWLLSVAAVHLICCAAMNTKKQCFGNGVCRTETNGQVSWSGPPEEVAKMQGKEEGQKQALADIDQAYANAPKRPANEPIRLLLIGPSADAPDLSSLCSVYRTMIETSLRGDPGIEVVPYDRAKFLVEAKSGDDARFSSFNKPETRKGVDPQLTHRLRDFNSDVDVVLVAYLDHKETTGFVRGGGGAGVAQVVNVEFQGSLSSVYQFSELKLSRVGKSTDSLAVAGFDKEGKARSGQLKGKRNPERDGEAINEYAGEVKALVHEKIAPTLPSMAAIQEIRGKTREMASKDAPDWMKKLMAK